MLIMLRPAFSFFLVVVCLGSVFNGHAQDKTVDKLKSDASVIIKKDKDDTIPRIWHKGGLFSLNLAQSALNNWAAGGDNFSLTLTSYLNLYAFYKKGRYSWDNTLDFYLGYLNTTSLGSRKNDDRIDILSKYGYSISEHCAVAALFDFRTQFFKGYNFSDTSRTLSSNFLSPAYILLGLGLDYKPTKNLSIYISPLTLREIIVKDPELSAKGLYGVPPGKKATSELGAYATINYLNDLGKTMSYRGRLDLFSNYKHEPENVDVFMSNVFSVKLSRILSATWNLDLIYDDNVRLFGKNHSSAALQVKSIVGAGILVKF
jgi:hypothetical protein